MGDDMSYLADILKQLDTMKSTPGANVHRSDRSALWDIVSGKLEASAAKNEEWQNIAQSINRPEPMSFGRAIGEAGSKSWNAVGRLMDVASRGLYTNAATMQEELKQGKLPASPFIGAPIFAFNMLTAGGKDRDKIAKAAAEGFTGKRKVTTSDLLKDAGMPSGFGRTALGFAGDVALDPLTYVPAGAFASVGRAGAKSGLRAVGKELPDVLEKGGVKRAFRVKNKAEADLETSTKQTKDAPTPEKAATQSLDETGAAKVNTTVSDKVIANVNAPTGQTYPFDVVDTAKPAQNIFKITAPKAAVKGGARAGQYLGTAQANLAALRAKSEELLKPFEGRRYAEDTEIKPFHLEEAGTKKELQEVTKTRDVPSMGSAKDEVKTLMQTSLDPKDITPNGLKVFNEAGRNFPFDLQTGAARMTGKTLSKGIQGIDVRQIGQLAMNPDAEIPKIWKKAHIKISGKLIPAEQFIKMLRSRAKAAETLGGKTTKESYTAKEWAEVPTVKKRKLRNTEILDWVKAHKDILDEEDATKLAAAGRRSYAAFDAAKEEILAKTTSKQYGTLDDLAEAVAKGEVPADVLKERLGKGYTLANLKKRLAEAEEKVSKHTETHQAHLEQQAQKAAESIAKAQGDFKKHFGMPSPEGNPELMQEVADTVAKAEKSDAPMEAFRGVREQLQSWQSDIVKQEAENLNKKHINLGPDYNKKTNTGARTTADKPYTSAKGKPVRRKSIGQYPQMEMAQNIINKTSEALRVPDAVRPDAMFDTVMPMLHASDQLLKEAGIPPVLGTGDKGFPMSMHDILSSLDRNDAKELFFGKVFNKEGAEGAGKITSSNNLAPTQLMEIAEQFVHLGLGNLDRAAVEKNVRELLGKKLGTQNKTTSFVGQRAGRGSLDLDKFTEKIMAAFDKAQPALHEKLKQNIADTVRTEHFMAKAITKDARAKYDAIVSDPRFSPGAHIQAAVDAHKFVDEAAYNLQMSANHAAIDLAKQGMSVHVAETIPVASAHVTETMTQDMAKAANKNQVVKAQTKVSKEATEEAAAMVERDGGNKYDLGRKMLMSTTMSFLRRIVPDLGNEELHTFMLNYNSAAQTYVKDHAQVLAQIHAKYEGKDILEGWNTLKTWKEGMETTPVMDDLMAAMKDIIDVTDGKFGFFNRQVKDVDLLTEDYARFGIPEHIKLDPKDLENSWRQWDTDDPLDLFSRLNAAHTHAVSKQTMGADLSHHFGYDAPAPGRVKITDKHNTSELAKWIDTDKWYDEDIARQMHMLDDTLKNLKKGATGGSAFLKNLDIATQMWKAGVTIYRPGHHVRNAVGDIWLASMDGVTPQYYKRSLSVLSTRRGQYKDFDPLRAAAPLGGPDALPKNVLTLRFNGQERHFTGDQMYRLMHDAGALPSYDVIEDVSLKQANNIDPREATGLVNKVQNLRIPGGAKAHKIATGVSEGRDHYIRIAHFIRTMEKAQLKGRNFDEAVRNAAFEATSRVRKYHPDGSDLTQAERKYMRRIVPFYSWVRKAIPLVLETAVQKPGKVMVYPKAMYNWAEGNGIDLEGYGNPFPVDQMFPSWISDATQGPVMGAAGAYAGINPGIPSADIADQYLANPKQLKNTILSSLHPFARIPIEMATGTKLRTGGPITDMSDYIDQNIPMGSYVDQLAGGRSLSTGFMQQNYEAPSNEGWTNPNVPPGASFINWLTGAGITDLSKPSYEKFAQLEQKRAGG